MYFFDYNIIITNKADGPSCENETPTIDKSTQVLCWKSVVACDTQIRRTQYVGCTSMFRHVGKDCKELQRVAKICKDATGA